MEENQQTKGNRGGYRPGSGNKHKWKHGETKPIRVPIAIAEEVLELARIVDAGGNRSADSVTQSSAAKGEEEVSRYQAEVERLTALNGKLAQTVGGLEADLIKVRQQLKQASDERDSYLDRISDIELELQNLKDDRVTESKSEDNVTQSNQETTNEEEVRRLNAELRLTKQQREDYRDKWERGQKDNSAFLLELKAQRAALEKLELENQNLKDDRVTQSSIDAAVLLNCLKDYLVTDKKGKTKLSLSKLETLLEELANG